MLQYIDLTLWLYMLKFDHNKISKNKLIKILVLYYYETCFRPLVIDEEYFLLTAMFAKWIYQQKI